MRAYPSLHPKRWLSLLGVLVLLLACTGALAAPAAKPAPNRGGQALEISPPVIDLTVDPGQTVHKLVRIRDVSPTALVVTGQINDFVAAGEDGQPKLLLDSAETSPYSVKGWITNVGRLTLVPREIKTMNVTISVPKNASPGGHYGVIRFTATPPELEGTGVSLSASLGALVLLRVSGDIHEQLGVKSFTVSKDGKGRSLFQSAPLKFTERFSNTGNVHLSPVGSVKVTDMFGRTLTNLAINQPPHNILPSSIRKFDQDLDKSSIGNKRLFGRYTATLNATYGESKATTTSRLVFWVIPYTLILTLLILAVIAFYVLRFALRRYNRHIVRQASGRRPKPPTRRR